MPDRNDIREAEPPPPLNEQAAVPDPQSSRDDPQWTLPSAVGDTSLSGAAASRGAGLAKPNPDVPVEFGRYRIVRELGAGAMGTVYLAEDTQLHRQVALKIPQLGNQQDPSRLERFFREARLAATLTHPNICPIYDIGNHDGTHFISMAFVQGRPLSAHLRGGKPVAERTAASLVRKLALALQEAHKHGVIHRDLKPANVMIDQRGEPIVMDFGLARQANGSDEAQITQSGAILGTPAFMSPEQVRGETASVGAPADQYALGVILYQMLAGRLPFEGPVVSVLMQIATQKPAPPSSHRPGIHPALEAICLRAMAREVPERFADTAQLANALTQFLRQSAAASQGAASPGAEKRDATAMPFPVQSTASAVQSKTKLAELAAHTASPQSSSAESATPHFAARNRLSSKWLVPLAGLAALVVVALGFLILPDRGNESPLNSPAGGPIDLAQIPIIGPGAPELNAPDFPQADAPVEGPAASHEANEENPDTATGPETSEEQPDWENLAGILGEPAAAEGMPADGTGEPDAAAVPDTDPGPGIPEMEAAASEETETEDESEDAAADAGSKKRKPGKTPVDVFPAGSIWKGKMRQWFRGDKNPKDAEIGLQVLERGKGTFRIRYWGDQGLSVEAPGRIRNNQIEWNTENAEVTGGTIGRHRFVGKISNGNRLELRFVGQTTTGQGTLGVGTFHRQN